MILSVRRALLRVGRNTANWNGRFHDRSFGRSRDSLYWGLRLRIITRQVWNFPRSRLSRPNLCAAVSITWKSLGEGDFSPAIAPKLDQ